MSEIIEVILDRQVKYNNETYPKGKTVPVKKKDLPEFKESGMINRVKGDVDEDLLLDDNAASQKIKELKTKLKKINAEEKELKNEVTELKEKEPPDYIIDLESKTATELYELTQELEIEGRTKLRNDKEAMIQAIKEYLRNKFNEWLSKNEGE
jgi:predicted mannosyl-3-phosphoglycerate phosphatase (HAD superfamily)